MVVSAMKQTEKEESPEEIQKQVKETPVSTLDKLLGSAQNAYAAYAEAERELTRAYKENEARAVNSYNKAEQRLQAECDEFIARTLKEREEAIERAAKAHSDALRRAEEAFRKAKQESDELCRQNVAQGQSARRIALDEALKVRDATIAQAWAIYAKIKR
ncbi:hypothetical protein ACFLYE_02030 [Chloroflexota bacterium]